MQLYFATSGTGVIVTSHGNSADSPHCSWFGNCQYNNATRQECTTALCRAQGYERGTFLSASNNFCERSFTSSAIYVYGLKMSTGGNGYSGQILRYNTGNEAQITAECYCGNHGEYTI